MSLSIDVDEDLKHFSMLERALSTYNNELSNLIKELTGALVDDFRKDISHVSDGR